jgi:pyridoxamine 5'-phosphate oxidase
MSQTGSNQPTEVTRDSIRAMRRSYGEAGLEDKDLLSTPIAQFKKWLHEASNNIMIVEANAMVLGTVLNQQPTSRTVLLKDVQEEGFSFFTNYESGKAQAINENPNVSLVFPWYAMERQVLVRGSASKVSASESDDYFETRPWGSKIGAWASAQSTELDSRETLANNYNDFAAKYPERSAVPRPPHWGGYLVSPTMIEFWQGRYSRLHDRVRFTLQDNVWHRIRLNP